MRTRLVTLLVSAFALALSIHGDLDDGCVLTKKSAPVLGK